MCRIAKRISFAMYVPFVRLDQHVQRCVVTDDVTTLLLLGTIELTSLYEHRRGRFGIA